MAPQKIVVIGAGMAAVKLAEELVMRAPGRFRVELLGEEAHAPYNRILLSHVLNGTKSVGDTALKADAWYAEHGIRIRSGARITNVDPAKRTVHTAAGERIEYDHLVFATGSVPLVPPWPERDLAGVFVFRTLDDCARIGAAAAEAKRAVVIGGGLLGLEAANGLRTHGVDVTVVHLMGHLMEQQLDATAGATLLSHIERLGIRVLLNAETTALLGARRVYGIQLKDGAVVPADLVVISCGIRPRVDVARQAGLDVNRGIVVDAACRTTDPHVSAIGECAEVQGQCIGLVEPAYQQAGVVAARLVDEASGVMYEPAAIDTRLKVLGVDVVSLGDAPGKQEPGARIVRFHDEVASSYAALRIADDHIVGATLVGAMAARESVLRAYVGTGRTVPADAASLLFGNPADLGLDVAAFPDETPICSCNGVNAGQIRAAACDGPGTLSAVCESTHAGTGCGTCKGLVSDVIAGVLGTVARDPRESYYVPAVPLEKADLVEKIQQLGLRSVSAVLDALGEGAVDAKSKIGLASLLKSLWNDEYDDERDARFINDRVHANIQRDGTFSVVPRIYGGVTSPEQLRRIAEVAEKHNVPMVKVTGGQRIDLLGIPKEKLPEVWADLEMPSGHAYTKAVRTCKTCIGTNFCRFALGDSVGLGIAMEQRLQGIEMPHKVKMGVSACPRNCAEATIKDVGMVMTDHGIEVHVGGNGGAKVKATEVLATVQTHDEALLLAGRFLQYYREHAKYLERTAPFVERLGIQRLREVIVDDVLGIAADLDARMQQAVDAYEDPWLEGKLWAVPRQFNGVTVVQPSPEFAA